MKSNLLTVLFSFLSVIAFSQQRVGGGAGNCGTGANPCPMTLCTPSSISETSFTITVPAGQFLDMSFDQEGGCGGSTGYRFEATDRVEITYGTTTIIAFDDDGVEAIYSGCFENNSSASIDVTISVVDINRRDEAIVVDHTISGVDPGGCALLPIEMASFTAFNESEYILLRWETLTETSNDFMVLERSSDGRNFEPIETVQGAGNSIESITYEYKDEEPHKGYNYYRIRQVDYDGTTNFSSMVATYFGKHNYTTIKPTIATNAAIVEFSSPVDEKTELSIFNQDGRWIRTIPVNLFINKMNIDVEDLNPGLYWIQVQRASGNEVLRLVKQ